MDDVYSSRKLARSLKDIISYGELVIAKLSNVPVEALVEDCDLLHATTYRVLCLSEAARNAITLDPGIIERHPLIPWPQIRAIGNRLRHEYGDIRADIIWETVRGNDVRSLIAVARYEQERHVN